MLKINLETSINNIAYLEYMKQKQEEKVNVDQNNSWCRDNPPQRHNREWERKNHRI